MSVPYVTFMKHAESVCKNASAARPVLNGVFHAPDGSLVVTDSHRLYRAKNAHSVEDGAVIQPKTGEHIEGSYPQIDRLIPEGGEKGTVIIEDIKQTIDGLKALLAAGLISATGEKKTPKNKVHVDLYLDDEGKVFLATNTTVFKGEFFLNFSGELEKEYRMKFRAEYLLQALNLFKDAGAPAVSLKVYGPNRPFVLTPPNNDNLLALILPVRVQ